MEINVQDICSTRKKIRVRIPSELVREKNNSVFRSMAGEIKVKGFRKGKIPRGVFESMYGEELKQETVSKLISDTLSKALLEKSLSPVNKPEITEMDEFVPGGEFAYSVEFEVMPEFELADYSSIPVKKQICRISDEDVEASLEKFRQSSAQLKLAEQDRPAKDGDCIKILYTGVLEDGTVFLDDAEINMIIGEGNLAAGRLMTEFENNLRGKKTGEGVQFAVKYPEDLLAPGVAGKIVTVHAAIKEIYDMVVPELDDDFAKDAGKRNMDELRDEVRKMLESSHEKSQIHSMRAQVADHLVSSNQFNLPSSLVEEKRKDLEDHFIADHKRAGIDEVEINQSQKEKLTEKAVDMLKTMIIIRRIAHEEKVEISHSEIDEQVKNVAYSYGVSPDRILKAYDKDPAALYVAESMVETRKVLDILLEKAVVEEVDPQQVSIDNKQPSQ